jgi:hypothetical protein
VSARTLLLSGAGLARLDWGKLDMGFTGALMCTYRIGNRRFAVLIYLGQSRRALLMMRCFRVGGAEKIVFG